MARYGRDFDRGRGMGGYGMGGAYDRDYGGYGGMGSEGRGYYGGMGSDAYAGGGSRMNRGYSDIGTGGGAYDREMNRGVGYGGYGMGSYGQGGQELGGRDFGNRDFGGRELGGRESGTGWATGGYGAGSYGGYGATGYGSTGTEFERGFGDQGFGGQNRGGQSFGNQGFGQQVQGGRGNLGFGGQAGSSLRNMRAADIMTDNPETVTGDTTLADAAKKMRDLDVGIIPVVDSQEGRRLRGVVTDRDIAIRAVAEGKDPGSMKVSEVMTTELETCNKNDPVENVIRVMEREQVRRVPITDREGRIVGIIAQADVATELTSRQGMYEVADALEHISEPGRPQRGGMRASQGRGGGAQGGMSAGSQAQQGGGTQGGAQNQSSGRTTSGRKGRTGQGENE